MRKYKFWYKLCFYDRYDLFGKTTDNYHKLMKIVENPYSESPFLEDDVTAPLLIFDMFKFSRDVNDILSIIENRKQALIIRHSLLTQMDFLLESGYLEEETDTSMIDELLAFDIIENAFIDDVIKPNPILKLVVNGNKLPEALNDRLGIIREKMISLLISCPLIYVEEDNKIEELVLNELGILSDSSLLISKCISSSISAQWSLCADYYSTSNEVLETLLPLMVNITIKQINNDEIELKNNLNNEKLFLEKQVTKLQRQWKQSLSDPNYLICKWRLLREFQEMENVNKMLPKLMVFLRNKEISIN